jgi:DNA-binding NtrC family response regulator
LSLTDELVQVRFSALDNLAQLSLLEGDGPGTECRLHTCEETMRLQALPARSWYDLAHQITRCTYHEQLEDWPAIIAIADEADAELKRRQYKAIRTALLCAKARALARLGQHSDASAALAAAVRACPRGAVDPLIVVEASKALCASLRGNPDHGSIHYDRALAACRAIGHRYHEWWITAQRDDVRKHTRETVHTAPQADVARTSLLLSDVATMLGAGHSIDLLAHRLAAILQATTMAPRVEVVNESGREYRPEPSAEWDTAPDGTCTIRIEGSDRLAAITVRDVTSIEEISLLKSLADLVQIAVARTADTEHEDEDLTLWPQAAPPEGEDTIFRSPRMVELLRIAERLAATDLPLLITGETGTGKEVLARFIHEHSAHKRGPFVPFNCSAVARDLVESQLFGHRRGAFTGAVDAFPGLVRSAERGTLFLDEIGDLESVVQPKLLRFLESSEIQPVGEVRPQRVGVRVLAATNADLEALAKQGKFRSDLYYRIGVVKLELPPLRERKDEIPAFASLFLTKFSRECGRTGLRLADDLIAALLLYDWPGNIRQLANELRRVAAMAADGQVLGAADLAPEVTENWNTRPVAPARRAAPAVEVRLDQPLARAIEDLERQFIEHALHASSGRVADAAQLLGLSRKGLFLKRRRAGLT